MTKYLIRTLYCPAGFDEASPFFVVSDAEVDIDFLLHLLHMGNDPHDAVLLAQ
jgi:hypothetical protein